MPRNLQRLRVKEEESAKVSEKLFPRPPTDENVQRNSSESKPPIPARDEMNENMDNLPARDSAHGPRDGLDSAHGSQPKQPDSANNLLAGLPRSEEAGRGSTTGGHSSKTLIQRLRDDRASQLRRQRAPKRQGSEPTEDGSRDPFREVRRG